MGVAKRLALIPSPFGDETFGSWLHRCAEAHHTTVRGFANAVLALNSQPHIATRVDWDTAPPPQLLDALAGHSALSLSELECLLVHPGPATLPPVFRDSYCPKCLQEDLVRCALHFRRSWLDAWALTCPIHGCLLGRFSRFEYGRRGELTHFPGGTWPASKTDRPTADNPIVRPVALFHLRGDSGAGVELPYVLQPWLDPTMLHSLVGRDLIMIAGSEQAQCLHRELFGFCRPLPFVWRDGVGKTVWWPQVRHPLAGIEVRVMAAYVASALWHCFLGSKWIGSYAPHIVSGTRRAGWPAGTGENMTGITQRWNRAERVRWAELFAQSK
ncbi:MAG TPA: TniQ family protein [Steroidobacteraceae bacterium]|nr:TniQ family protein [Steroidobacteraceae bacterium]